ncbi:MAG: hypothetical protein KF832_21405 [Caldilineaceae bacterium]|nr:hypothetical protein [Caldilineaceae bacterium]
MGQRFAFVLRIWVRRDDNPENVDWAHAAGVDGVLRGTLQAADSPSASHFSSLQQLHELLMAALEEGAAPSRAATSLPPANP